MDITVIADMLVIAEIIMEMTVTAIIAMIMTGINLMLVIKTHQYAALSVENYTGALCMLIINTEKQPENINGSYT